MDEWKSILLECMRCFSCKIKALSDIKEISFIRNLLSAVNSRWDGGYSWPDLLDFVKSEYPDFEVSRVGTEEDIVLTLSLLLLHGLVLKPCEPLQKSASGLDQACQATILQFLQATMPFKSEITKEQVTSAIPSNESGKLNSSLLKTPTSPVRSTGSRPPTTPLKDFLNSPMAAMVRHDDKREVRRLRDQLDEERLENDNLQTELDHLRQEKKHLEERLNGRCVEVADLNERVASAEEKLKERDNFQKALLTEKSKLQQEIKELQNVVCTMQGDMKIHTQDRDNINQKLLAIEKQKDEWMKVALDNEVLIKQKSLKVEELLEELTQEKRRCSTLQQHLDEAQFPASPRDPWASRSSGKEDSLASAIVDMQLAEKVAQLETLDSKLETLSAEKLKLETDAAVTHGLYEAELHKRQELEKKIAKLNDDFKTTLMDFASELQGAHDQREKLRVTFDAEKAELEGRINDLLANNAASQALLTSRLQENDSLSEQVDALKSELKAALGKAEALREAYTSETSRLETEIRNAQTTLDKATYERECELKVQWSHFELQKSSLEKRIVELEANVKVVSESLQKKKESLQKKKELLHKGMESLQKEKESLQKEIESLQKGMESLQMEKGSLQTEKKLLQTEKESLQTEKELLQTEMKSLQKGMESLQTEKKSVQTEMESLQKGMESLQTEKELLQAEKESLQTEKESLETEKKSLQTEIESLETEKKSLQTEKESLQTEKKSLQTEMESLQKGMESLQTENQSLQTEKKSLQAEMESLQKVMESLQTENQSLQTEKESLETEKKSLQTEMESLETEKKLLQTKMESLQTEMESLQTETKSLQTEKELLQAEKESLQTEKASLQKGMESLQMEKESLQMEVQSVNDAFVVVQTEKTLVESQLAEALHTKERLLQESASHGQRIEELIKKQEERLSDHTQQNVRAVEALTSELHKLRGVVSNLETENGRTLVERKELEERLEEQRSLLNERLPSLSSGLTALAREREELVKTHGEFNDVAQSNLVQLEQAFANLLMESERMARVHDSEKAAAIATFVQEKEAILSASKSLEEQVSDLQTVINEKDSNIAILKTDLTAARQDAVDAEDSRDGMFTKLNEMTNLNMKLEEQLQKAQKELKTLSELKDGLETRAAQLSLEVVELSGRVKELSEEVVDLKARLASSSEALTSAEKARLSEKEHLESLLTVAAYEKQGLSAKLKSLGEEHALICDQLNTSNKEKTALGECVADLKNLLDKKESEISLERQKQVRTFEELKQNLENDLKLATTREQELLRKMSDFSNEMEATKTQLKEMESAKKALELSNAQLSAAAAKNAEEVDLTLKSKELVIRSQEERLQELTKTISENEAAISSHQEERASLEEKWNVTRRELQAVKATQGDSEAEAEGLRSKVADLQGIVLMYEVKGQRLALKEEGRAHLQTCLNAVLKQKTEVQSHLARLRTWLDTVTSSCDALRRALPENCDAIREVVATKRDIEQMLRSVDDKYANTMTSTIRCVCDLFKWTACEEDRLDAGDVHGDDKEQLESDLSSIRSLMADLVADVRDVISRCKFLVDRCDVFMDAQSREVLKVKTSVSKDSWDGSSKSDSDEKVRTKLSIFHGDSIEKSVVIKKEMHDSLTETQQDGDAAETARKLSTLQSIHDALLAAHRKLEAKLKEYEQKASEGILPDYDDQIKQLHKHYAAKLETLKVKMDQICTAEIDKVREEKERSEKELVSKYEKSIAEYKGHVQNLSSQLWKLGDKLLQVEQEKKALQDKLALFSGDNGLSAPQSSRHSLSVDWLDRIGHEDAPLMTRARPDRQSLCERKRLEAPVKPKRAQTSSAAMSVIDEVRPAEPRNSSASAMAPTVMAPASMGVAFPEEDEDGELFNNTYLADMKAGNCRTQSSSRISEFQLRNSLCPPHLKSSYPAETQFHDPKFMNEDEIKVSHQDSRRGAKDRSQTSYKRPGPPTPSKNGRRLSLQGKEEKQITPRAALQESNRQSAGGLMNMLRVGKTTPSRIRALFVSSKVGAVQPSVKDENDAPLTPTSKRMSIFKKRFGPREPPPGSLAPGYAAFR